MAIHIRTASRLQTVRLPRQPVLPEQLVGNTLVFSLALAILTIGVILAGWSDPDTASSAALQRVVGESLSRAGPDTPERLVRTSMSAWGDFTIEFVLREPGDAGANRAAALEDMLAVARGVYQAPAPRPANVTLLGVWRPSPDSGIVPLL